MENARHVILDLPCLKMVTVNNALTVAANVLPILYTNAKAGVYRVLTKTNKSAYLAHKFAQAVNLKPNVQHVFLDMS